MRKTVVVPIAFLFLAIPMFAATKVCIDPGHGGPDPGNSYNGIVEKDATLDIARLLRFWMQQDTADTNGGGGTWGIVMTRDSDIDPGLARRPIIANEAGADRFVSIHLNAATNTTACGTETYCQEGLSDSSLSCIFRGHIHDQLIAGLKLIDRGKKKKNLQVLRDAQMPAALSEGGFLSCASDAAVFKNSTKKTEAALSHLFGLQMHYSITPYVPTLTLTNQTMTPVSASQGWWRHYKINVPSGQRTLTITLSGGTGDGDLYVRRGNQPTTSTYGSRSRNANNEESIQILSPQSGDWYIGVYGSKDFSATSCKARYSS
ncbi:MAG TPA: N-acetylmuramoyl-L-alanine amidase [Thermoanaerobaculia bacterium]|jgi:N-acetylmuramoyl-L-alanine amidase|nr:N-acetylmuramoyl-L-alanine amidase [Thermoanaerobaculia bacterium]